MVYLLIKDVHDWHNNHEFMGSTPTCFPVCYSGSSPITVTMPIVNSPERKTGLLKSMLGLDVGSRICNDNTLHQLGDYHLSIFLTGIARKIIELQMGWVIPQQDFMFGS